MCVLCCALGSSVRHLASYIGSTGTGTHTDIALQLSIWEETSNVNVDKAQRARKPLEHAIYVLRCEISSGLDIFRSQAHRAREQERKREHFSIKLRINNKQSEYLSIIFQNLFAFPFCLLIYSLWPLCLCVSPISVDWHILNWTRGPAIHPSGPQEIKSWKI